MFEGWPLLSLLVWFPIAGGVALMAIGGRSPSLVRWLALLVAALTFLMSLPLWSGFDPQGGMQFVERVSWIPAFGIDYALGVDGIAMPMILLTTFSTLIVVVASWESIKDRQWAYLACFLIMQGVMVGVFAAMDAILFYVFWEAMLVPMFLIIGVWGGENRIYATIKFFLYTFLGSVLMLVALVYLRFQAGSFAIADMYGLGLPLSAQVLVFIAFLLAFAVKVPMWPVHTWLPDAHVEAPTGGSVILAAIMLKIGAYGFLRFSLPITPNASLELSGLLIALSLIAIVYIGLVAMIQKDMKKLIAYSSIAHMGFVTLGFFVIFPIIANHGLSEGGALMAMEGGMVQMVAHGFVSSAMFLCVGVLYDRMHTREIESYGGVINTMPMFAAFFVLFAMANTGLPGTASFVGEFLVILASFKGNFWYSFLAATALITSAAYTLWMIQRVVFGPVTNDNVAALTDINTREFLVLFALAIAVLWLGLYPAPLVEVIEPSLQSVLDVVIAR
jgi:NADH-quinone oxidoreductase subunit M